jgi:hypothetical protein
MGRKRSPAHHQNGLLSPFYMPQQLPGVPHELGDPQQPPPAGPSKDGPELFEILGADISFTMSSPSHFLHFTFSSFPNRRNSLVSPHAAQRYSYIGILPSGKKDLVTPEDN